MEKYLKKWTLPFLVVLPVAFMVVGCDLLLAMWGGFQVGDIGPSGGYVFYDKGSYSNGWRYLEAAPAGWSGDAADPGYAFGYYRPEGTNLVVSTGTGIGSGKGNTDLLVTAMGDAAYSTLSGSTTTTHYAAKMCTEYRGGGNADWFLPSKDELNQMYRNLSLNNLGGFSDTFYWSSSEYYALFAFVQYFRNGNHGSDGRASRSRVRPVRAF